MIIARIDRMVDYRKWFRRWKPFIVPCHLLQEVYGISTRPNDCIWIVPGTYQDHEEC